MNEVTLIDHMGDDLTVVNAARVSMAKESDWLYQPGCAKHLPEQDSKLIRYLATHAHWTPFSHVMLTLRIKMPIFIARQWYRHTVGFTRNETSRRYVDDALEFFIPEYFRTRAESVKQGSSDEKHQFDIPWKAEVRGLHEDAARLYDDMIENGIPPEQARMFVPQTMMTEFYETASLAAYARLCKQRLDPHAQMEIRRYAEAVVPLCEGVAPVSWAALMEAE